MNEKYICYCGLYCENCATMAKVEPAAKALYDEMKNAGFEEVIEFIPQSDGFWAFLQSMATEGICTSCKEGSGNPACTLRLCASEKGVLACALCKEYPCPHFDDFFEGYPILLEDNKLLREKGLQAWGKLQDERRKSGFTYSDQKDLKEGQS